MKSVQLMSFVAGLLVIRCMITIKAQQAHHDMMLISSVRSLVCPFHIPHQSIFTQVHVTPSDSVQSRNSFLMLSGCSRIRVSFVPTVTANIVTKNRNAKSPRPWVYFPGDRPRCLRLLQHRVRTLGRLLPTLLPLLRPRLYQFAKLVNERSLMQLSVVYPAP
jgi:hypothetical protein